MLRVVFGLILSVSCFGAVTEINVIERSDVLDGASTGAAGPYERIIARAVFQVDPKLPANRIIADIDLAPRDAAGRVEFSADLYVLKPRDPAKANGTVLFEVSNRGGKGMLGMFNRAKGSTDPRDDAEFGDRLLLQQGFTLVWLGWQHDTAKPRELLRAYLPVATQDGKPITGLVRAQYTPDKKVETFEVSDRNHTPYPAIDPDDKSLQLTVRDRVDSSPRTLDRSLWKFSDPTHVTMAKGFEPGKVYELVYTARDPVVAGLGLAAIRDIISFLKYGGASTQLGDQRKFMKRAIGFGTSQSGRALRTMIYQGFNSDEQNRRVFDGVWAHVGGAGRGSFNQRFAQPSRDAQPVANLFYPTDIPPYTDAELIQNAAKANVAPKMFYTNGSYEYWGRAASLIHTTPDGKQDAPPTKDSRIYFNTGAQHTNGAWPPARHSTRNLVDPLDYRWQMRALLSAMQNWLKDGKEPPPSQYPTIAAGQLVLATEVKSTIADPPSRAVTGYEMDFGPEFAKSGIATIEPPKILRTFTALVPQVDADGIDVAGLRLPEIQVPLGTYTGWNQRDRALGAEDQMIAFSGSFFPFARTKAERLKTHDPRLSIEERYRDKQDYLDRIASATQKLVAGGYLLEADAPKLSERAQTMWDYVTAQK